MRENEKKLHNLITKYMTKLSFHYISFFNFSYRMKIYFHYLASQYNYGFMKRACWKIIFKARGGMNSNFRLSFFSSQYIDSNTSYHAKSNLNRCIKMLKKQKRSLNNLMLSTQYSVHYVQFFFLNANLYQVVKKLIIWLL